MQIYRANLEIAIVNDFSRQTDFIDLPCERGAGTERPIKLTNANTSHLPHWRSLRNWEKFHSSICREMENFCSYTNAIVPESAINA